MPHLTLIVFLFIQYGAIAIPMRKLGVRNNADWILETTVWSDETEDKYVVINTRIATYTHDLVVPSHILYKAGLNKYNGIINETNQAPLWNNQYSSVVRQYIVSSTL